MRKLYFHFLSMLLLFFSSSFGQTGLSDFITIKGDTFQKGIGDKQDGAMVRVENFEMLSHPVTNREYKLFIDDTGYPAPPHWSRGNIPPGKEDYPVIFVNRFDVNEYVTWLTKEENRIYRLPTTVEFEFAARGGLTNKKYPWGNEDPKDKANYDPTSQCRFDEWQKHLKPVSWGTKNNYGLYGMAGNVWQMTANFHDPATMQFKYRIEDPVLLESSIMGGSWARSEAYLQCGYQLGSEPGIRHPDIGFRVVREINKGDWAKENRKLAAV